MATTNCIVCNRAGEHCDLCEHRPTFCPEHLGEHRSRVHADRPNRSVDDAIADALAQEGIDPD